MIDNKDKLIIDIPLTVPNGHCNVNKIIYPKSELEKMFSSDFFIQMKETGTLYLYDINKAGSEPYSYFFIPITAKVGTVLSFDDNKATILFDDPDYIENLPYDITEYSVSINALGQLHNHWYNKLNKLDIKYATNMRFIGFVLNKTPYNPYINIVED